MKIFNLLLAVVFIVFAFVQINDPDPFVWILVYGSMAVLCVMAAFRNFNKWITLTLLAGFILFSVSLLPGVQEWMDQEDRSMLLDDVAKMQHPFVEESREFLGLMICIAVLVIHIVQMRLQKR